MVRAIRAFGESPVSPDPASYPSFERFSFQPARNDSPSSAFAAFAFGPSRTKNLNFGGWIPMGLDLRATTWCSDLLQVLVRANTGESLES